MAKNEVASRLVARGKVRGNGGTDDRVPPVRFRVEARLDVWTWTDDAVKVSQSSSPYSNRTVSERGDCRSSVLPSFIHLSTNTASLGVLPSCIICDNHHVSVSLYMSGMVGKRSLDEMDEEADGNGGRQDPSAGAVPAGAAASLGGGVGGSGTPRSSGGVEPMVRTVVSRVRQESRRGVRWIFFNEEQTRLGSFVANDSSLANNLAGS